MHTVKTPIPISGPACNKLYPVTIRYKIPESGIIKEFAGYFTDNFHEERTLARIADAGAVIIDNYLRTEA